MCACEVSHCHFKKKQLLHHCYRCKGFYFVPVEPLLKAALAVAERQCTACSWRLPLCSTPCPPREVLCRMQNVLFFQKCLSYCKYHCEYFCIVTTMFVLRWLVSDRTALWPLTVSVNQPTNRRLDPPPLRPCCLLPAWSLSHKSLCLSGTLVSTCPYLPGPIPCVTCTGWRSFFVSPLVWSHSYVTFFLVVLSFHEFSCFVSNSEMLPFFSLTFFLKKRKNMWYQLSYVNIIIVSNCQYTVVF